MFPQLKYPTYNIRLMQDAKGKVKVFDEIRRKWLQLTPEEWVRQHLINYLVKEKKYPISLISVEKELVLNDTKKRYDIVVYSKSLEPIIIIECKAPEVNLSEKVLEQALRYNLVLKVPYLMISNGLNDFIINGTNKMNELPNNSIFI